MKNKLRIVFVVGCLLGSAVLSGQTADFVGSIGAGASFLNEDFTENSVSVPFVYDAPAVYAAMELDWGAFYMDMNIGISAFPFAASLGSTSLDFSNYDMALGIDFTAIGLGYLYEVAEGLYAGGAIGFHVTSAMLSPAASDPNALTLEGNYGLIGINLTPRFRYDLNDSFCVTVSVPVGIDFGAMSDEVILPGGIDTGNSSPAVIGPAGLVAGYQGWTAALYISIGYRFPLGF